MSPRNRAVGDDVLSQKVRAERLRPETGREYQRRLEALNAVLNGEAAARVASTAHVSVRTVRRWMAKAQMDGVRTLQSSSDTILRGLTRDAREQIARDLASSPRRLGIEQEYWGGRVFARYLQLRYGLHLGTRHCRRILRKLGVSGALAPRAVAAPEPPKQRPLLVPRSDSQIKREALRRIQRLALSGLPMQTFVTTLLDLIEDAIPSGPNQALLSGPGYSMATPRLMSKGFDPAASLSAYQLYGPETSPEISGMIRPPGPLSPTHPVLRHEEVALPHFYRSAGYNELFRLNRQHHLLNMGWLEDGRLDFRCTIWRSEQMKPFTDDDARFAAAIVHHIRHGITIAEAIDAPKAAAGGFVRLGRPAPGLLYLDGSGRVRAMDSRAEEIFRQLGAFDADVPESLGLSGRTFTFEAISRRLREILLSRTDPNPSTMIPREMIYSNKRGLAAKLSGFVLTDANGSAGFAVLVELGESRELLRRRVQYRFGLSHRQAQVLELIACSRNAAECARALGISPGTLRSHLRDLMERLELPGFALLRKFAQDHLGARSLN